VASLKLSATDEMIRCCRAVLAAAETSLAEEGLPLPESRYVSVQGGDWIVGVDCEDCCSQLIVTPLVEVTRFNDPTTVAAGARDSRQAYARLTTWEISVSGPVNLAVLTNRLRLGTVAQAPTAASNENTHWSETVPIMAASTSAKRSTTRSAPSRTWTASSVRRRPATASEASTVTFTRSVMVNVRGILIGLFFSRFTTAPDRAALRRARSARTPSGTRALPLDARGSGRTSCTTVAPSRAPPEAATIAGDRSRCSRAR
jgi:hypothetical protein